MQSEAAGTQPIVAYHIFWPQQQQQPMQQQQQQQQPMQQPMQQQQHAIKIIDITASRQDSSFFFSTGTAPTKIGQMALAHLQTGSSGAMYTLWAVQLHPPYESAQKQRKGENVWQQRLQQSFCCSCFLPVRKLWH